jgi:hypothetical protein
MHFVYHDTERERFRRSAIAFLAVCVPIAVFSQQISNVIFMENFEDRVLAPNATVEAVGSFNVEPGIKETDIFGSAAAFGFGKSTCTVNCWNDHTCVVRIEFPDQVAIGLISFKEAELGGNWGSTGYVAVDG